MVKFSDKNINTVSQLYSSTNLFISWHILQEQNKLQAEPYFQWKQLISAILRSWKDIMKQNTNNSDNFLTHNHHVIRGSKILTVTKITHRELQSDLVSTTKAKPSSNTYFEHLFKNNSIDWKAIYMLPQKTAYNTYLRSFQYKILHNIHFLNQKLFIFWFEASFLCLFGSLEDEISLHLFLDCHTVKPLRTQSDNFFLMI